MKEEQKKHDYPKTRKKIERVPLNKEQYDRLKEQVITTYTFLASGPADGIFPKLNAFYKLGCAISGMETICKILGITAEDFRKEGVNEVESDNQLS